MLHLVVIALAGFLAEALHELALGSMVEVGFEFAWRTVRYRSRRRSFPFLCVALLAVLAPARAASQVTGTIAGTFRLRTLNGKPLPWAERLSSGRLLYQLEELILTIDSAGTAQETTITRDGIPMNVPCATLRRIADGGSDSASGGAVVAAPTEADTSCEDLRISKSQRPFAYTLMGSRLLLKPTAGSRDTTTIVAQIHDDTITERTAFGFRPAAGNAPIDTLLLVRVQGPEAVLSSPAMRSGRPATPTDSVTFHDSRAASPNTHHMDDSAHVPEVFASVLPRVKARSRIPVLLPSELPEPIRRAKHAVVESAAVDEYVIALYYEPGIGNAGFAGAFGAKAAGRYNRGDFPNVREEKLANGSSGFFRAVSCGGSCAPANLWWREGGALYQIQVKLAPTLSDVDQEGIVVGVANSAITAGPR